MSQGFQYFAISSEGEPFFIFMDTGPLFSGVFSKNEYFFPSRRGISWKNIIEHSENNGPWSMKMHKSVARVHEILEN